MNGRITDLELDWACWAESTGWVGLLSLWKRRRALGSYPCMVVGGPCLAPCAGERGRPASLPYLPSRLYMKEKSNFASLWDPQEWENSFSPSSGACQIPSPGERFWAWMVEVKGDGVVHQRVFGEAKEGSEAQWRRCWSSACPQHIKSSIKVKLEAKHGLKCWGQSIRQRANWSQY